MSFVPPTPPNVDNKGRNQVIVANEYNNALAAAGDITIRDVDTGVLATAASRRIQFVLRTPENRDIRSNIIVRKDVISYRKQNPVAPTIQVQTLTITGAPVVGTTYHFVLRNLTGSGTLGIENVYDFNVTAQTTSPNDLATRIRSIINLRTKDTGLTAAGATNVVTITASNEFHVFELHLVGIWPAHTNVTTTPPFAGHGTYTLASHDERQNNEYLTYHDSNFKPQTIYAVPGTTYRVYQIAQILREPYVSPRQESQYPSTLTLYVRHTATNIAAFETLLDSLMP